jgi:hypothetical protein
MSPIKKRKLSAVEPKQDAVHLETQLSITSGTMPPRIMGSGRGIDPGNAIWSSDEHLLTAHTHQAYNESWKAAVPLILKICKLRKRYPRRQEVQLQRSGN